MTRYIYNEAPGHTGRCDWVWPDDIVTCGVTCYVSKVRRYITNTPSEGPVLRLSYCQMIRSHATQIGTSKLINQICIYLQGQNVTRWGMHLCGKCPPLVVWDLQLDCSTAALHLSVLWRVNRALNITANHNHLCWLARRGWEMSKCASMQTLLFLFCSGKLAGRWWWY